MTNFDGNQMGGASSGQMRTSYLFVDGGYLTERAKTFGETWFEKPAEIDYRALGGGFTKVFYYDCLPPKTDTESDTVFAERTKIKEDLFNRLRDLPGWHVSEGLAKWRKKRGSTQKEIDILIAVDMLGHTYRRNMQSLTFLAGDQDFRPLLEAVVRDGMYVNLIYDPTSISMELKHAADNATALDLYAFHPLLEEGFRKNHPIPGRSSMQIPAPTNGILREEGYVGKTRVATLWKSSVGNEYTIVRPLSDPWFAHMTMQGDVPFLKRVDAYYHGECVWTPILGA